MQTLTGRQTQVVEFIRSHSAIHQRPPTRHEIAAHFGWRSDNAAEEHLKALVRKGAVRVAPGKARGIEVV